MRIQVTDVGGVEVKQDKNGKDYRAFTLNFVSEGKAAKKMLFVANGVGKTLVEASVGSLWDIATEEAGKYTNWISAKSAGMAEVAEVKKAEKAKSTYETPEERARRQILIVRQSTLANAIALLTANKGKEAVTLEQVFTLAGELEMYVFDTQGDNDGEVE